MVRVIFERFLPFLAWTQSLSQNGSKGLKITNLKKYVYVCWGFTSYITIVQSYEEEEETCVGCVHVYCVSIWVHEGKVLPPLRLQGEEAMQEWNLHSGKIYWDKGIDQSYTVVHSAVSAECQAKNGATRVLIPRPTDFEVDAPTIHHYT